MGNLDQPPQDESHKDPSSPEVLDLQQGDEIFAPENIPLSPNATPEEIAWRENAVKSAEEQRKHLRERADAEEAARVRADLAARAGIRPAVKVGPKPAGDEVPPVQVPVRDRLDAFDSPEQRADMLANMAVYGIINRANDFPSLMTVLAKGIDFKGKHYSYDVLKDCIFDYIGVKPSVTDRILGFFGKKEVKEKMDIREIEALKLKVDELVKAGNH